MASGLANLKQLLPFDRAVPPLSRIVGRRQLHPIHWVRRQHKAPLVTSHLETMPHNREFAAHSCPRYDRQAFVAVRGDLSWRQPVQRETGERMAKNDA